MYVSMPICLDLCFHMPMCLDLCSLHGLYDLPCVRALQAMFVCLDLGYVCHTMLQHNKAMDTNPNLHLSLADTTFVCLLSCLISLFTRILDSIFATSIMFIYFMPLIVPFACFPSRACLLVSCLCLCMEAHGIRMHGARARSPGHKQKRRRCEHMDMSQAAVISKFRSLAFPFGYVLF